MSSSARPAISAVLPAHDEVAVIAGVVSRVHAALSGAGLPAFEVIVVDDGSTDGTGSAVERLGLPSTRVLRHPSNRGYGAALRTGFDAAQHQAIWLLDGDGQFDPADLHLLLERWAPDAYVTGYREERRDGRLRKLNHDAFFAIARRVVGPLPRDVNCAFRLFPRRIGRGLTSEGAVISTEMALRARRDGLRLVEVAVPHHPRLAGTPSGASPSVVLRAFVELATLRRRMDAASSPDDAGAAGAAATGGPRQGQAAADHGGAAESGPGASG